METLVKVLDSNRLVKFGVVGATGVAVNTGVLYLGYEVVGLPLLLASVLAIETAILNNFLWNNIWTFAQSTFTLDRLAKFNLVSLGGLVIAVTVLYILVHGFGLHYLIANLLAISVSMGWNFIANSLWTWSSVA